MKRREPARQRLDRLLILAASLAAVPAAAQSPAIFSLSVPMEVVHDSNPLMAAGGSPGTTWLRVSPAFTGAYVLGNDRFELEAGVTAEKSSNTDVARDRVDPRLRAAWKREGERDAAEVAVVFDRTALRSLGLRERVPLGVDGSRTLAAVTGQWRYEVDERTAFSTEARQEWVRFADTPEPDYRRTAAAVRLTRLVSERQAWYVALDGQAMRTDAGLPAPARPAGAGTDTRSSSIGLLAGVTHAFSEAWRLDVAAGPTRLKGAAANTDWQGIVKAEYTAERWSASLDLARTPVADATFGGLVIAQELRLRARRELGGEARLEFEAGHARESASGNRRSLASIAWVRQLAAAWELAVKASTHRQDGPGGHAASNRVALVLTYIVPDF